MRMSAVNLTARRTRLWRKLRPTLARTPALTSYADHAFADFPITEIADVRADYGMWNSLGLSDVYLRTMADAAEKGGATGALSAGWSSGTNATTRGIFLASPSERADYIGQSLARLLPASALFKRQRLALHLRASNALYRDVDRSRFVFAHFPLEVSIEETVTALKKFEPTILIAPPHRLIAMAEAGMSMPSIQYLFCGSEPISKAERAFITKSLGLRPRAIYQATEGFLGAECAYGRLHLNDHAMEIELEPVPGTTGQRPIITDLRRLSQPIVRLRGDDYLQLDPNHCNCGFAGRVIHAPQGRVGDIWHFYDQAIAPPQIVSSIEAVLGATIAWQAEASPDRALLHVSPTCPSALAQAAALTLIREMDMPVPVEVVHDLHGWNGPKRRKVVWRG